MVIPAIRLHRCDQIDVVAASANAARVVRHCRVFAVHEIPAHDQQDQLLRGLVQSVARLGDLDASHRRILHLPSPLATASCGADNGRHGWGEQEVPDAAHYI